MKTIVTQILTSVFDEYINPIEGYQLDVALWQGNAQLKDVTIKSTALSSHELPFTVTKGTIKFVKLHFPWSSINSQPCEIDIEGININAIFNKNVDLRSEIEIKESILKDLEEACKGDEESQKGILSVTFSKIVDNIVFRIKDVHICIELATKNETNSYIFTAGIVLDKIECFTINDKGEKDFVSDSNVKLRKQFIVSGFSIYLDSEKTPIQKVLTNSSSSSLTETSTETIPTESTDKTKDLKNHQLILDSFSFTSFVTRTRNERSTQTEIKNEIEDICFKINQSQLIAASEFKFQTNMFNLRCKYFLCGHPKSMPRSERSSGKWWRFVHRCTIEKRFPNRLKPDEIIQMLKTRHTYLQLWEKRQSMPIDQFKKTEFYETEKEIERSLNLNTILFLRCYSEYQIRNNGNGNKNDELNKFDSTELSKLLSESKTVQSFLVSIALNKITFNFFDSKKDDKPELTIGAWKLNGLFTRSFERESVYSVTCDLFKIFTPNSIIFQQGENPQISNSSSSSVPAKKTSDFSLVYKSFPAKMENELEISSNSPRISINFIVFRVLKALFIEKGFKANPSSAQLATLSLLDDSLESSVVSTTKKTNLDSSSMHKSQSMNMALQKICEEYPFLRMKIKLSDLQVKIENTKLGFNMREIQINSFPIHERYSYKPETLYDNYQLDFCDLTIKMDEDTILKPVSTCIKVSSIIAPISYMDKLKLGINISSISLDISRKSYIELIETTRTLINENQSQETENSNQNQEKEQQPQQNNNNNNTNDDITQIVMNYKSTIAICIQQVSLNLIKVGQFQIVDFGSLLEVSSNEIKTNFKFHDIRCNSTEKKFIDFHVPKFDESKVLENEKIDFSENNNAVIGSVLMQKEKPTKTEVSLNSPTILVDIEWIENSKNFFKVENKDASKLIDTAITKNNENLNKIKEQQAASPDSINVKLNNPKLVIKIPSIDKTNDNIEFSIVMNQISFDKLKGEVLFSKISLLNNERKMVNETDISFMTSQSTILLKNLDILLEEPDYPLLLEFFNYAMSYYDKYLKNDKQGDEIKFQIPSLQLTLKDKFSAQAENLNGFVQDAIKVDLSNIEINNLIDSQLCASATQASFLKNNDKISIQIAPSPMIYLPLTFTHFIYKYFIDDDHPHRIDFVDENERKVPLDVEILADTPSIYLQNLSVIKTKTLNLIFSYLPKNTKININGKQIIFDKTNLPNSKPKLIKSKVETNANNDLISLDDDDSNINDTEAQLSTFKSNDYFLMSDQFSFQFEDSKIGLFLNNAHASLDFNEVMDYVHYFSIIISGFPNGEVTPINIPPFNYDININEFNVDMNESTVRLAFKKFSLKNDPQNIMKLIVSADELDGLSSEMKDNFAHSNKVQFIIDLVVKDCYPPLVDKKSTKTPQVRQSQSKTQKTNQPQIKQNQPQKTQVTASNNDLLDDIFGPSSTENYNSSKIASSNQNVSLNDNLLDFSSDSNANIAGNQNQIPLNQNQAMQYQQQQQQNQFQTQGKYQQQQNPYQQQQGQFQQLQNQYQQQGQYQQQQNPYNQQGQFQQPQNPFQTQGQYQQQQNPYQQQGQFQQPQNQYNQFQQQNQYQQQQGQYQQQPNPYNQQVQYQQQPNQYQQQTQYQPQQHQQNQQGQFQPQQNQQQQVQVNQTQQANTSSNVVAEKKKEDEYKNYLHEMNFLLQFDVLDVQHKYNCISDFCDALNFFFKSLFSKNTNNNNNNNFGQNQSQTQNQDQIEYDLQSTFEIDANKFIMRFIGYPSITITSLKFIHENSSQSVSIESINMDTQQELFKCVKTPIFSLKMEPHLTEMTMNEAIIQIDANSSTLTDLLISMMKSPLVTKLSLSTDEDDDNNNVNDYDKKERKSSALQNHNNYTFYQIKLVKLQCVLFSDDLYLFATLGGNLITSENLFQFEFNNFTLSFAEKTNKYEPIVKDLMIHLEKVDDEITMIFQNCIFYVSPSDIADIKLFIEKMMNLINVFKEKSHMITNDQQKEELKKGVNTIFIQHSDFSFLLCEDNRSTKIPFPFLKVRARKNRITLNLNSNVLIKIPQISFEIFNKTTQKWDTFIEPLSLSVGIQNKKDILVNITSGLKFVISMQSIVQFLHFSFERQKYSDNRTNPNYVIENNTKQNCTFIFSDNSQMVIPSQEKIDFFDTRPFKFNNVIINPQEFISPQLITNYCSLSIFEKNGKRFLSINSSIILKNRGKIPLIYQDVKNNVELLEPQSITPLAVFYQRFAIFGQNPKQTPSLINFYDVRDREKVLIPVFVGDKTYYYILSCKFSKKRGVIMIALTPHYTIFNHLKVPITFGIPSTMTNIKIGPKSMEYLDHVGFKDQIQFFVATNDDCTQLTTLNLNKIGVTPASFTKNYALSIKYNNLVISIKPPLIFTNRTSYNINIFDVNGNSIGKVEGNKEIFVGTPDYFYDQQINLALEIDGYQKTKKFEVADERRELFLQSKMYEELYLPLIMNMTIGTSGILHFNINSLIKINNQCSSLISLSPLNDRHQLYGPALFIDKGEEKAIGLSSKMMEFLVAVESSKSHTIISLHNSNQAGLTHSTIILARDQIGTKPTQKVKQHKPEQCLLEVEFQSSNDNTCYYVVFRDVKYPQPLMITNILDEDNKEGEQSHQIILPHGIIVSPMSTTIVCSNSLLNESLQFECYDQFFSVDLNTINSPTKNAFDYIDKNKRKQQMSIFYVIKRLENGSHLLVVSRKLEKKKFKTFSLNDFNVSIEIPSFFISLIDDKMRELALFGLINSICNFNRSNNTDFISILVDSIQVDDMFPDTIVPVALFNKASPFVTMTISKPMNSKFAFKQVYIKLQNITLYLDLNFISEIVYFVKTVSILQHKVSSKFNPSEASDGSMITMESMKIEPFKLNFSISSQTGRPTLHNFETDILPSFIPPINDQWISLPVFEKNNINASPNHLFALLIETYKDSLKKTICNFLPSPEGIAKGLSSVFHQLNVSSNRNMNTSANANITPIDQKSSPDKRRSARAPVNFNQSANTTIGEGFKAFGQGFLDGITGVVTQPMYGFQENGASGLFGGIAKGVAGLILSPAAGFIDATTGIVDGVKNSFKVVKQPLRFPRVFTNNGQIVPYDKRSAMCQIVFQRHIENYADYFIYFIDENTRMVGISQVYLVFFIFQTMSQSSSQNFNNKNNANQYQNLDMRQILNNEAKQYRLHHMKKLTDIGDMKINKSQLVILFNDGTQEIIQCPSPEIACFAQRIIFSRNRFSRIIKVQ